MLWVVKFGYLTLPEAEQQQKRYYYRIETGWVEEQLVLEF
jgi:hypothetical protein